MAVARRPLPDRYASLVTALAVYRALRRRAYTRTELAAELGTAERTVRRLIDALEAADVPITEKRRGHPRGPLEFRAGRI